MEEDPAPPPAKPVRRKRRWFQYSLRTLLIATTIIAALFALQARWSYKAGQQQDVVIAISGRAVVCYGFQADHVGTRDDYVFMSGYAQSPPYWPKWLVQALGVDYFANVESVWIALPSPKDDYLELLKPLTKLKRLGLRGTWTSDANLEQVNRLTALQLLDLESTKVTDAGLRHLKGLTALEELYLANTRVTDDGLTHLKELATLQVLDLQKTQVSDEGVQRLRKALPNCNVFR